MNNNQYTTYDTVIELKIRIINIFMTRQTMREFVLNAENTTRSLPST